MSEFAMIAENTVSTTEEVTNVNDASGENVTGGGETEINEEEYINTEEGMEGIMNAEENNAVSLEGGATDSVNGDAENEITDGQMMEGGDYAIPEYSDEMQSMEGDMMYNDMGTETVEVKDPLLSSWPFVIGISAAVFVVSIAVGALLARLKIKKGIDLYED